MDVGGGGAGIINVFVPVCVGGGEKERESEGAAGSRPAFQGTHVGRMLMANKLTRVALANASYAWRCDASCFHTW
eukprot:366083-Chlamydomonas_euryale.AAC.18